MDMRWFEDLARLAETGNFSRAAEINNISQSAFSRRIRALEEWLGAPLVERAHHPVHLTVAGEQILEAAQQALSRIEMERAQIREALAEPDRYVLTFAAQHSIGWRFYPVWHQAFELEFGPVMSRLRADDLPNCTADLHQGVVDFVISYESKHANGVEPTADIQSLKIGTDWLIPVCKPDSNGKPLFPIDASDSSAQIPFLKFDGSAPIRKHIEPILAEHGILPRLSVIYENSMAGALRIRARDGLGVAWLPLSLVQSDLDMGLLTWAGSEAWGIEVEIRIHRLKRNPSALVSEIWSFLEVRQDRPLISAAVIPGSWRQTNADQSPQGPLALSCVDVHGPRLIATS